MKLQGIYLLLVSAIVLVSGCSDSEQSGFEQVPIELRASDRGGVTTKADQLIAKSFETTIFASKRNGIYTGIPADADEWQKDATVQTNGSVSLSDDPSYPKYGEWLYLVAVSPKAASSYNSSAGTVTYTLNGQTDLMYASQIRGNRWEGSRFQNPDGTGTPLTYVHLLTQLKFKAQKAAANGLTVKVKSIAVKGQKTATVNLISGETNFSGGDEALKLTLADGGTEISETTPATTDLGCLLLPPLASNKAYKLSVETSIGTFEDLDITFESVSGGGGSGSSGSNHFAKGHSYEITLNIGDRELEVISVTVADWTTVKSNGDLELVE